MHNLPRIRIRECDKGWVVETLLRQRGLFRKEKWGPVLSYTGMPEEIFHFSSAENAIDCVRAELGFHVEFVRL